MTRLRLVHGIEPLRLPLREVKVTTVQICCAIPEGWFDGRRDLSSHSSAVDRTSFESGQGAGVRFSPCEPHSDPSISPTNFWLVFRKKKSGVCLEGGGTNVYKKIYRTVRSHRTATLYYTTAPPPSLSAYSKPRAAFSRNSCRAWLGLDGVFLRGTSAFKGQLGPTRGAGRDAA